MLTATMTLAAIYGLATEVRVGGPAVMIQATCLDADGRPSGALVELDSSDETIATVTTAEQLGAAPAGVVGQKPGNCVITATAKDGSGKTATLDITVI